MARSSGELHEEPRRLLGGGIEVQTVRYAQLHGRQGLGFGAANLIRPAHACCQHQRVKPILVGQQRRGVDL
jgi:hypothetical protein